MSHFPSLTRYPIALPYFYAMAVFALGCIASAVHYSQAQAAHLKSGSYLSWPAYLMEISVLVLWAYLILSRKTDTNRKPAFGEWLLLFAATPAIFDFAEQTRTTTIDLLLK